MSVKRALVTLYLALLGSMLTGVVALFVYVIDGGP